MSLLAQEKSLSKFQALAVSSSIKSIALSLAHALEKVLVFKPQLEAMVTAQCQVVFREDWHYYAETESGNIPYNFLKDGRSFPGDIKCQEDIHVFFNKTFLEDIWHNLDYAYLPNPLMHVLVADFLTYALNEDQYWVSKHADCQTHFLQNYVDLGRLVENYIPDAYNEYLYMEQDIHALRADFAQSLRKGKTSLEAALITPAEINRSYQARGVQEEERLIQDFWDRSDVQSLLDDMKMHVQRIINSLFPTIRNAAERSSMPAYGYDVFQASVVGEEFIVVKNIGDYRILHWELNKE